MSIAFGKSMYTLMTVSVFINDFKVKSVALTKAILNNVLYPSFIRDYIKFEIISYFIELFLSNSMIRPFIFFRQWKIN